MKKSSGPHDIAAKVGFFDFCQITCCDIKINFNNNLSNYVANS